MNLLRPTLLALVCLALPVGASDLPSLGDASSSIFSLSVISPFANRAATVARTDSSFLEPLIVIG